MGLRDFAGGTVLRITAGVGALAAVLDIGNRYGSPNQAMPPQSDYFKEGERHALGRQF
jgi:Amt family ammonium transporter